MSLRNTKLTLPKCRSDVDLAKSYLSKAQSSMDRGIKFNLSFMSYKNLMSAKTCKYTGVRLTDPNSTANRPTDRSIDRIDNTKGYESGNVVACCVAANQLKSAWENPQRGITMKMVSKMIAKLEKMNDK